MKIPAPFLNMILECPECTAKEFKPNTPDMVAGHLVETHGYNVGEADDAIQAWMDDFPKDSDGSPLATCEDHGFYHANDVCHGCEAYERRTNLKGE